MSDNERILFRYEDDSRVPNREYDPIVTKSQYKDKVHNFEEEPIFERGVHYQFSTCLPLGI